MDSVLHPIEVQAGMDLSPPSFWESLGFNGGDEFDGGSP